MRDGYSTASIRRTIIYAGLIAAGFAGMAQVSPDDSAAETKASGLTLDGKTVVIKTTSGDFSDGRRFKNFRDLLKASEKAEAIIFDLNVSGESPWEIYGKLLEELPKVKPHTVAFVNPSALEAGAILAVGTDAIYLSPVAVIGGAGLRMPAGDSESSDTALARNLAQEISVLKARARSLAKLKGHDSEVVEAFIDSEFELKRGDEVISPKGEILTLTAEEAVAEHDGKPLLASGIVESLEALIAAEKLSGEIFETSPEQFAKDQAKSRRMVTDATASDATEKKEQGDGLLTRRDEGSFQGKILVLRVGDSDLVHGARFEFMERTIKKAKLEGATGLILDMDTPGGRVWETAELITKTLQETPFPTITFVNTNAVSAGSLVALATETIYMYPASNIGSALIVSGSGVELGENMQQKVDQMMISTVRNVAELRGHNPDIAEAFVSKEKEVIIEGVTVSEAGTVLNLNATEATEILDGRPVLAKGIARSVDEIIEREGLEGELYKVEPLGMESLAHWVQRFSIVLIILGLAGAYTELQAPGFGVPGVVSLLSFGLFFFGNHLAGNLAGFELAVLLVVGLILIGIEIFILPGTLIFGVSGAVLVIATLGIAMIDKVAFQYKLEDMPDAGSWANLFSSAAVTMAIGILGSIGLLLAAMRWLPESKAGHWMVLKETLSEGAALEAEGNGGGAQATSYVGLTGKASTNLHPAGKGTFGDLLLDIISDGEYVDKGTPIRVVNHEGPRIVVEQLEV